MRLANRIFASHVGIIAFSALATTLAGALLISRAVGSEAVSRVESDLRAARTFLDDRVRLLEVSAQLASQGLPVDPAASGSADLTFIATREEEAALAAAGVPPGARAGGLVALPRSFVTARLPVLAVQPPAVFPDDRALCLFAAAPGPRGTGFAGCRAEWQRCPGAAHAEHPLW